MQTIKSFALPINHTPAREATRKHLMAAFPPLLFLLALAAPSSWYCLPGLTVTEQRVIAIFLLAAFCWVLEPIPIFATAMLVVVAQLLLVSDKGFSFLMAEPGAENFGTLLSHREILGAFSSPTIMLLLGGFFLAMAATKYKLDINLARVLLKPFGTDPRRILLGLMVITAVFSMFMSNTATTVMMLAIMSPVLATLPENDSGRTGFILSVPVAANIGGIGTPIGTPPNAIALKYISEHMSISFGEWMLFAAPFVLALIIVAWFAIAVLFPCRTRRMECVIEASFLTSGKAWLVYATFATTVALWISGEAVGLNSAVVGMIPVAVFLCAGVITKEDLQKISWDVLWLVAGGLALGIGLEKTGLAVRVIESIPFASFPPFMILLAALLLTVVMANFMSHTATANLLLPLMAALAGNVGGVNALGGSVGLLLGVTFAASLGMMLPVSTPPNALASATGAVATKNMATIGGFVGFAGLALTLAMLWLMSALGWF